jgi:CspA family cold shock protein
MNQINQKKLRLKKGTVHYYNERKGYGLIEGDDGKDLLVYKKDLDFLTLLNSGDEIVYKIKETKQGPKVIQVKIRKDSLFRSKCEPSSF